MQRRTNILNDDIENPNTSNKSFRSTYNKYRLSRKLPSTLYQIYFFGILSIIFSIYFFFHVLPGNDYNDSQAQLQNQRETIDEHLLAINELKGSLEETKKELLFTEDELKRTKSELHASKHSGIDLSHAEDELKKTKEKLHALKKREMKVENNNKEQKTIDILKKQVDRYTREIQAISRREVEEKFGVGPHRVKITIEFPPEAPFPDKTGSFTIELAPIDLMPHAVYLFLQQVSHKLWDGYSFHRNAGHVIQSGEEHYFNTPRDKKEGLFEKLNLEELSFQEYSASYPHEAMTVGFAGRPGGPDWYVSLEDNTENHGPGGQEDYDVKSEADSCFGKVIDGIETIKLMHKMPKKPGDYEAMKHNVGIKSARIID